MPDSEMPPRCRFLASAVVLLFLQLSSFSASAQSVQEDSVVYRPEVERTFNEALSLFNTGKYEEAVHRFSRIIDRFPESHRITAAYVMSAKAHYELGEYQPGEDLLRDFLGRFRKSRYVADAHYTLGLISFQLKRYDAAAREFLLAWQTAEETKLKDRAERMLTLVASTYLQMDELRQLLAETGIGEMRALLTIRLAERVLNTGDVNETKELLRPVARMPKTIASASQAAAMLERIERSGVVKIGVVLPLKFKSDTLSAGGVGEELLNGIRLAVDEYNAEAMPKVNLEVRDSERDAGVAARQVSELSMDNQVLAIVGPLFSNEAIACANLANARGVPLITPTATSNGIAAVGEYVFQANPDFSVRGRAMAQYAYRVANARRFAVLSAADTADKQMTDAFLDEVNKLGGEVVDVQWYNPGETDLRTQLFTMRQRAMEKTEPIVVNFAPRMRSGELKRMAQWGVAQRVLDSLVATSGSAPVEYLFGENGLQIADSLKIPTQRLKAKYDSLGIPVTYIDALFLPIASSSEVGIVSSQVRYFNFQTQLLGTGNWNDLNELDQNRQYANGIVFTTDVYWEEIDQQYRNFSRSFRAAFSRNPTPNAMFGYDAMRLVLRLVRNGATRREDIVSALGTVRSFQGVHSKICFSESRVNSCLTLLQFKNRSVKKVGEIDVNKGEVVPVK
ncbi:MAG: ABC transporter substrate-binding protein [Bacteroidota bacterium]